MTRPSRSAISDLRDELYALGRQLDLRLGNLLCAETDGDATVALDQALALGHAIADRLEAFASPNLPAIGKDPS
jgi:hypothetical protein